MTLTATVQETAASLPGCNSSSSAEFEASVVKLINQERTNAGLQALTLNNQLSAAARKHSLDMACNNFFSHTGSDGSSPFDRISTFGYTYTRAAENLYAGSGTFNDPVQAVAAWMASPGHRQNVMNPDLTNIGVSYVFTETSKYGAYYTTTFGRP